MEFDPKQYLMNESSEDDARIKAYAYHEAGHAIAHYHFEMTLVLVSINEPKKGRGGVTQALGQDPFVLQQKGVFWENTPERTRFLSDRVITLLAGEVAQEKFCPGSVEPHHSRFDQFEAKHLIAEIVPIPLKGEREGMLEKLFQETRELIDEPSYSAAVEALAQALIEHKELSGKQATGIIRDAIRKAGSN